jgi:hypothetical protein
MDDDTVDSGPVPDGSADVSPPEMPAAGSPLEIYQSGNQGLYDISLENDPNDADTVWMSYTGVTEVNLDGHSIKGLETRLAKSTDRGISWTDVGVRLNHNVIAPPVPAEFDGLAAAWVHEVSRLVYDRSAPASERWKVMWHRYLHVEDGTPAERKVQYGWISMKAASSPEALADAQERKLFGAKAYTAAGDIDYKDAILGAPEVQLDDLHADLAGCVAVTEPGMWSSEKHLYVSLVCLQPDGTPSIFALRHDAGTWTYLGTLLEAGGDELDGSAYKGFSASDIVENDGSLYLLTSPSAALYDGCAVFAIDDLDEASLVDADDDGLADVVLRTGRAEHGGLNPGACGYASQSEGTGITYGEIFATDDPFARQYRSMQMLP